MNIREEIMYMASGDSIIAEDVAIKNFMKVFGEDVKAFGLEEAVEIYSSLYGLNELKGLDVINEATIHAGHSLNEASEPGVGGGGGNTGGGSAGTSGKNPPPEGPEFGYSDKRSGNTIRKVGLSGKIKALFHRGATSVTNFFKSGNWKALVGSPLFKGALAAGGVAAAILIIKKLFEKKGKKITKEQEAAIRAEAEKADKKK